MNIKYYRIAYNLIKLTMACLKHITFCKRLDVPAAVFLRIQVCWDMTLCCWVSVFLPSKGIHPCSTLGSTNPAAQYHIAEDMNPLYTSVH